MKDFEFSLDDDADFMLKNFKKNFMIWVVPVTEVLSYLVRLVWSRAVYPRSFPSGHAKLSKFLYHQIVLLFDLRKVRELTRVFLALSMTFICNLALPRQ